MIALDSGTRRTLSVAIACSSILASADLAYACRRASSHNIAVATMEQALDPRPGEISFVGKIIESGPSTKLQVIQRIQGDVPDIAMVELWCSGLWGKVGETIPVIAIRYEGMEGLLFGIGGGWHLGADGREHEGRGRE